MLAEFDDAVARFRESAFGMNGNIGALSGSDHTLRTQSMETARDVFACCNIFRGAYDSLALSFKAQHERFAAEFAEWPQGENVPQAEYDAFWEEFRRRKDEEMRSPEHLADLAASRDRLTESAEGRDMAAQFAVVFKALFFFIRAHQDSLCALVFLAHFPAGSRPGEYSMSKHLKQRKRVYEFVMDEVPGYEEWFWHWRDLRNQVKRGANFSYTTIGDDLVVGFSTVIPDGGGVIMADAGRVTLMDLITGLNLSTNLQLAISRVAAATTPDRDGGYEGPDSSAQG